MRDSLDEEERGADQPPSYDPAQRSNNNNNIARDVSPLPAPQAQKPIVPPRESLDGDTIFAVGEDDKWSSEESGDEEESEDEEDDSDDSDDSDESGPSNSKAKDSERSRLTGRKND